MRLLNLLLFLTFCELALCKGYFTVVGAKQLKHQGKYYVSVASHGYEDTLEVAVRNSKKDSEDGVKAFEVVKNISLVNGDNQRVEFDLKGQPLEDYSLEVKSLTGEPFNKTILLDMSTKSHTVFMQTDKSIYKPADKIQFRVLLLDEKLKPFSSKKVEIFITDGADNRIKQFKDVKFNKGVFQNELQLSDSPVLGTWKIHVKPEGFEEETKDFDVLEYTLPKFEVTIETNPNTNFKDGKVRATVKAQYTFGKIAKGNATVTAELERWYYWNSGNENVKVTKTVEVNGKKAVEFDLATELKLTENRGRDRTLKLHVSFVEELTGRELNATSKVTIHSKAHDLDMSTSSSSFKPGLPFIVTAILKTHDKAPVTDQVNPIHFFVKYFYETNRTCERIRYHYTRYELTVDEVDMMENGTTTTPEPTTTEAIETYECREEHSFEKTFEAPIVGGISELDLEIYPNTSRLEIRAVYLNNSESTRYIQKVHSESGQFIQIRSLTQKPKLAEFVKIEVLSTHNLKSLTAQVVRRGELIETKVSAVPNEKKIVLEIKPTLAMMPKVSVIIYYISDSGEIISDNIDIEFENELKNHINVDVSKAVAKPGDNLEISLSTNPGSFVGLLGVDQSVLILKKGNDIDSSMVTEALESFESISKYNYQWSSDYDWRNYRDFQGAGAFLLTNAKSEYDPPYVPLYYPHVPGEHHRKYHSSGMPGPPSAAFGGSFLTTTIGARPEMAFDSVAEEPVYMSAKSGPPGPQKPIEIRKTFPETWMFDSFDFDASTRNLNISKKVPDTITSWIITGFSVDPVTGLGLTKMPTKLTVFQPFFVSTNLPYSIKRGEVVTIPIILFNYLDEDQASEVTFYNSEGEFEFVEVKEDDNKVRKKRAPETERKKLVLAKSQTGTTVPFMIRPLKIGHITIKVVASSAIAGDGVERQLIVEPEGVTQFKNKAVFIDLRKTPEFKTKIDITIPSYAVPDSTKIEASAVGDILGSSIANLDQLIKLPYGCGEQNMLNFVPNIVVLDYMTALNILTPEIESKAIRFMETGYQKELTYKHNDGSYSAFGKSDKSGSTWLTAFVAKSFNQASKYIAVDEAIVKEALNFLSNVQAENGSFPEVGHVSHKDMQGGSSNGIALTAYTLITFLENDKFSKEFKNVTDKALNYIITSIDALDDNYSLAIATYALQIAKHGSKGSLLAKLDSKSVNVHGEKHWEKKLPEAKQSNPWYGQPNSVNVEMSAYGLQAFIEAGKDTEAALIMKWLVGQRNKNGGFLSTQDTVVGIQALSKLAAKIYSPDNKVEIKLVDKDGRTTSLSVNEENALILQKHELPETARSFDVTATGKGFSILQLSYKYNLNKTGDWPRFLLAPKVNEDSNKDYLHLTVCTSFVSDETDDKSNMAVMEVTFPSGYIFDSDSTPELKATEKVKKVETKDGETVVVVYFDDVTEKSLCPEFKAYRTHSVAKQKPAPVIIYDYYDNARRAREFYNPPEISLCDICNGAEECVADCEHEEINVV